MAFDGKHFCQWLACQRGPIFCPMGRRTTAASECTLSISSALKPVRRASCFRTRPRDLPILPRSRAVLPTRVSLEDRDKISDGAFLHRVLVLPGIRRAGDAPRFAVGSVLPTT